MDKRIVRSSNIEKILTVGILIGMLALVIPLCLLGKYDYPTGDDYHYGAITRTLIENRDIPGAVSKAIEGVKTEYEIWQGTYSALFFMCLPPNVFSMNYYHIFPTILFFCLFAGIVVLLYEIGKVVLKEKNLLAATSLGGCIFFLWTQMVPSAGEPFFWYNGAMYYTGFFASSLLFGALVISMQNKEGFPIMKVILSLAWALFLAGGNYVSLLPCILIVASIFLMNLLTKQRTKTFATAFPLAGLLLGFAISAMAPGNAKRAVEMNSIPAWKAVAKSLMQGVKYVVAWTNPALLLVLSLELVLFIGIYQRTKFEFRYPYLVIPFAYGIFASMACPTFYSMNSTGPARVVALNYFGFVLFMSFSLFYLGGAILGKRLRKHEKAKRRSMTAALILFLIFFVAALPLKSFANLNGNKAIVLLQNGEAQTYAREQEERIQRLTNPNETDVILSPFSNYPDMICVGDIGENPEDSTNMSVARFYGKNSVSVVK